MADRDHDNAGIAAAPVGAGALLAWLFLRGHGLGSGIGARGNPPIGAAPNATPTRPCRVHVRDGRVELDGATLYAALKELDVVRTAYVVRNGDGTRVRDAQTSHATYRICRRAGLPERGWHVLRHSSALTRHASS